MSISSMKQSAGKLYRGNLGQGPGDGSFNDQDIDDGETFEMRLDESTRNQTDEKAVRLPVGSAKDNNSGPRDLNVFYGDLLDKNQKDDGVSGPNEETDDSGILEDAVKSKTRLKKAIKDEAGSSQDVFAVASTSRRNDDYLPEENRKREETDPDLRSDDGTDCVDTCVDDFCTAVFASRTRMGCIAVVLGVAAVFALGFIVWLVLVSSGIDEPAQLRSGVGSDQHQP